MYVYCQCMDSESPSPDSQPPHIEYLQHDLLKMPYNGPITLTKLSLLMQNNRHQVSVLILACLGTFFKRAISPKQSPLLYAYTNLFPSYFFLYAANCPSATIQKQLPTSPSLMRYLSAGTLLTYKFYSSLLLQNTSRSLKKSMRQISVEDYCNFYMVLPRRTKLNYSRFSWKSLPGVREVIVVARGWLQSNANYPNTSPDLYSRSHSELPYFQHLNLPQSTIQSAFPQSPSLITIQPFSVYFNLIFSMSWSMLYCDRCQKRKNFLRQMIRLALVYSGHSFFGGISSLPSCLFTSPLTIL